MKTGITIAAALVAGAMLGAFGNSLWLGAASTRAIAATTMPMSMPNGGSASMSPMPIGDARMMKAMTDMSGAMRAVHLNGDQDHDFMQMMIPHHEAAIEMARVELRYGLHNQIKSVARDIIKGQASEIARMRQWLCTWYADCKPR